MAQWKGIRLVTIKLQVQSLTSLSGLRIRRCCELWCRLKTWLRFAIAVAVAVAHRLVVVAPIGPLAWEPVYNGCSSKKQKTKNTPKQTKE